MHGAYARILVVAGLVLALAACGSSEDEAAAPAPVAETSSSSGEASPTASPSTSRSSSASASAQPSAAGGSGSKATADLEQRHPNGTVLRVLGVTSAGTSTTVEIEAVNGFTKEIQLNTRGIHLVDGEGNSYNFVVPEQNAKLAIPPAGTLTGTLTFLGEIADEATSLRLLINTHGPDETVDIAGEFDKSASPAFQIDGLPVPDRG